MKIRLSTLKKLIREELSRKVIREGVLAKEYAPDPKHANPKWMMQYKKDFMAEFEEKLIPYMTNKLRPMLDDEMQSCMSIVGKGRGVYVSVDKKKFFAGINKFLNSDGSLKSGAPEGLDEFVEPYVKRDVAAQQAVWEEFYTSLVPQLKKMLEGIGFGGTGDERLSAAIPLQHDETARIAAIVSPGREGVTVSFEVSATDSDTLYKARAAGGVK